MHRGSDLEPRNVGSLQKLKKSKEMDFPLKQKEGSPSVFIQRAIMVIFWVCFKGRMIGN